ncbi:MAG: Bcr/CflA family drug resistance efflux transporter, partial [Vibrio metschnikovii]|nr:Bcr/CflA family drug resistance efflux transporter [Vibrio metschnikovii]
ASLFPTTNQLPLGIIMLLMSMLAILGLKRVYKPQDPSQSMPLPI